MAPNIKHASISSQRVANYQVIRLEENCFESPPLIVDSASYWEWPSQSIYDFSIEHIESNLIKSASQLNGKSTLRAENDEYWAEGNDHVDADAHIKLEASSQEKADSKSYQTETSYESQSSNDCWNTQPIITRAVICNPNLIEAESGSYWQERTNDRTASDTYWQEAVVSENYYI